MKETKYCVENLSLEQARKNMEVISISNSEMTRTIFRVLGRQFSQTQLDDLLLEKKKLSKRKNSLEGRKLVGKIQERIDSLLFIPELISLKITDKRHYQRILDMGGVKINGKTYVPFIFSAGLIRRNSGLFINSEIKDQILNIFDNGRNMDVELVPAKYNSYLSLCSSSTYPATFPKIVIVPDLVLNNIKRVDYAKYVGEGIDPIVEEKEMSVQFNYFDGCGMVSPEMARQWSNDLELDYVGSTFGVRSSFLKGMCVTFDFHKFAREVSENYIIKDFYGKEVDIRNIEVIVSPSMFKLSESYNDTEDYISKCEKNGIGWGISKVNPKVEKSYCKTSYQYLQILSLKDNQINRICNSTLEWLSKISGFKLEHVLRYVLGNSNTNFEKGWFQKLDPLYRSLLLEETIINDSYLISHIDKSLAKKKNDSKKGNLLLRGTYQAAIPDLHLYCQHIFGMPLEPFLKEGESYSHYWNEKNVSQVVGVRSPIVYQSEVLLLNFRNDVEKKKWFEHIKSGIVLPANGGGLDFALAGGMDSDYDLLATIDSKEMIEGRQGGLPVVYDTEKAPKSKIVKETESLLHKAQMNGFGTRVGFLTNVSSSFYSLIYNYPKQSLEYNTILQRLKWGRAAQGLEIDRQKGLVIPPFPEHWAKYKKIKEDMTEEEKMRHIFNNKLLAEKRPYFFIYLYSHYRKKFNKEVSDFNNISMTRFGIPFKELLVLEDKTEEQQKLIDWYHRKGFFIDNKSPMNLICHHMEKELENVKITRRESSKNFDYTVLLSKKFRKPLKRDIDKAKILFKEYKSLKRSLSQSHGEFDNKDYSSIEEIYKYINQKAYKSITSNASELADLIVYMCYKVLGKRSGAFGWACFGEEIYSNIKEKKNQKFVRVPVPDEKGNIEYLFQNYSVHLINIEE